MSAKWIPIYILLFQFGIVSCSSVDADEGRLKLVPPAKIVSYKVRNASYSVRGKRYHPMSVKEASEYKAVGMASYYGRGSSSLKTASGSRINANTSMSAAHRTLPMPCKVRVTDLKTRRSVIVTINNRGPFIASRVIDLTYGAAKAIGLTPKRGVGKVMLEVISVGEE